MVRKILRNRLTMAEKKNKTPELTLVGLFDKVLGVLNKEIDSLPQTLQEVTPEKRLDFISKTLPLVFKFKESGYDDTYKIGWDSL